MIDSMVRFLNDLTRVELHSREAGHTIQTG